jgi:hypothetical protein
MGQPLNHLLQNDLAKVSGREVGIVSIPLFLRTSGCQFSDTIASEPPEQTKAEITWILEAHDHADFPG